MSTPQFDEKRDRFRLAVAATIKAARIHAGMSQRELAKEADLSRAMIVGIEDGHILCSLWACAQIAHALDTTLDAIVPILLDVRGAAE